MDDEGVAVADRLAIVAMYGSCPRRGIENVIEPEGLASGPQATIAGGYRSPTSSARASFLCTFFAYSAWVNEITSLADVMYVLISISGCAIAK
jgi:hypothetical protein